MDSTSRYADKVEFRSIILKHIEKILDISTHELRDQTIQIIHGSFTDEVRHEDSRISYIQSIENLAYCLLPYFDDIIKPKYEFYIKVMTAPRHRIKKLLKKSYEAVIEANEGRTIDRDFNIQFEVISKLKYAKKLFCELNLLLHRVEYLKSVVYSEDKNEIVVEGEEEGAEE